MTRGALIRRRWWQLLLYAGVGLALWTLIVSGFPCLVGRVVRLSCATVVSALGLVLTGLLVAGRRRLGAFAGLLHPWSYPPLWFAGVLGWAALLLVMPALTPRSAFYWSRETSQLLPWVSLGGVGTSVLLVILSVLEGWRRNRRLAPAVLRATSRQPGPGLDTLDGLVEWIGDDRPLSGPEQDRFGFVGAAARIAGRIASRAGSQAVVGDLGSGKSSLMQLVDHELRAHPVAGRVRLVPVELWQFNTPEAAVAGIVRAAVGALSQEVNVLHIAGLPGRYVSTMTAAGGALSALAKLVHEEPDPFDALGAIDRVLGAIDLRLCIWVEDLERFAGDGAGDLSLPHPATDLWVSRHLNPIRAVLHGLDRLEHVSVVAASTSLRSRLDVDKIARFVEEVPRLSEDGRRSILRSFRDGMRAQYSGEIDPATADARRSFGVTLSHFSGASGREGSPKLGVSEALAILLVTPRQLKLALRAAHDAWSTLHGEVDVDDLLCMSVLRACSPEGFALVRDHVAELQARTDPPEQEPERFAGALMDWPHGNRLVLRTVVDFVFPPRKNREKPQGLHLPKYWARYLDAVPIERDAQDQPVLHALRDDDREALLDVLEGPYADTLEGFLDALPGGTAIGLLFPLIARQVAKAPQLPPRDLPEQDVPGLLALWRLWLGKVHAGAVRTGEFSLQHALEAIEASFRIASRRWSLLQQLDYYMLSAKKPALFGGLDPAESAGYIDRGRSALRQILVDTYLGQPERLVQALGHTHRWALAQVVWGAERWEAGEFSEKPFPEWDSFAQTLKDAARLAPRAVLPALAAFVLDQTPQRAPWLQTDIQWALSTARCELLFGNLAEFLELFDPLRAEEAVSPELRAVLVALVEPASQAES